MPAGPPASVIAAFDCALAWSRRISPLRRPIAANPGRALPAGLPPGARLAGRADAVAGPKAVEGGVTDQATTLLCLGLLFQVDFREVFRFAGAGAVPMSGHETFLTDLRDHVWSDFQLDRKPGTHLQHGARAFRRRIIVRLTICLPNRSTAVRTGVRRPAEEVLMA